MARALIIVDVQNDFCEGGALPVDGGDVVASAISETMETSLDFDYVVATQDWHIDPGQHFSDDPDYVDSWPPHCVAGTRGAALHPDLDTEGIDAYFRKGQYDAGYSGFDGVLAPEDEVPVGQRGPGGAAAAAVAAPAGAPAPAGAAAAEQETAGAATDEPSGDEEESGPAGGAVSLDEWLRERDVDEVVVVGLATDYCVRATALDAVLNGYTTTVITGLTAGVSAATSMEALDELRDAGVELLP